MNKDKKNVCRICPEACCLTDGSYGKCFVRKGTKEGVIDVTKGSLTHISIEPVRKKPFFHLKPEIQNTLSIGSHGCNLHCLWCENHKYSQGTMSENSKRFEPEDIVDLAIKSDCQSVCFSFTEPLIHYEYLIDLYKVCKEKEILFLIKTNAYATRQSWANLLWHVDGVNIDYKGHDYKKMTGGTKRYVLDNITETLTNKKVHTEISIPLYNGINMDDLAKFAKMVASIKTTTPIHLLKVYPTYNFELQPVISDEEIQTIKQVFESNLKFVYLHSNG